jgi:putative transposase
MKTYKYRLYPTSEQIARLESILETCRNLYNAALAERRYAYRQQRKHIGRLQQLNQLPGMKEDIPELKQVHAQVLQDAVIRVDKAFDAFFRRVKSGEKPGYPRFKGKGWYDSFTYPQSGFSLAENKPGNQKLQLSKIGKVRIRLHRPIEGNIKTCSIKREGCHWYACFTIEGTSVEAVSPSNAVGIDMGLLAFAALSDGNTIENPRYLRTSESKLKHEQRNLSRKKKGSNSRKKQKAKLAKVHRGIANQRRDFLHKESRKLVNSYDTLVFEDLRVKNMVKNHHLAKSISDASWSRFIQYCTYKAENAGKQVILVNPRGTSQICSSCGATVRKTLAVRIHKCECGLEIDRDVNAAINILRLGTGLGGATALAGL